MNEDYWVIDIEDGHFHVAPEEARLIEAMLIEGIVEFIHFHDITGSLCLYRRECFIGMYEYTVEQRKTSRDRHRQLYAENQNIPGVD